MGEHLVLYDGVCGLCNSINIFLLVRDRRAIFDFASLQSAAGRSWLQRYHHNPDTLDTFYLVTNYRSTAPVLLLKSAAALFVMKQLGAPWRWLGVLAVVPRAWWDRGYDAIARNRYRVFGRLEKCRLPAPEYAARFIDV